MFWEKLAALDANKIYETLCIQKPNGKELESWKATLDSIYQNVLGDATRCAEKMNDKEEPHFVYFISGISL